MTPLWRLVSCIYPYLLRDSICSRDDLWFPAIYQTCFEDILETFRMQIRNARRCRRQKHLSHLCNFALFLRTFILVIIYTTIYIHIFIIYKTNKIFIPPFILYANLLIYYKLSLLHLPVLHFQSAIAAIKIIPTETLAPTYKNTKSIKYHK